MHSFIRVLFVSVFCLALPITAYAQFNLIERVPDQSDDDFGNNFYTVVEAANGNAWKYHLSFAPARFAAHTALRLGAALAPERMIRQFDWIYGYDVTKPD